MNLFKEIRYKCRHFYRKYLRSQRKAITRARIRNGFMTFFDGCQDYDDSGEGVVILRPKSFVRFDRLGITAIKIRFKKKYIVVNVHTTKPGLLIGKQGTQLEQLEEFLSKCAIYPIKINLFDTKIW